jgi:hypothetical protein
VLGIQKNGTKTKVTEGEASKGGGQAAGGEGPAAEGEPAGASDEVAVQTAEPAAPSEPDPAGNVGEAEASGGVVPEEPAE